MLKCTAKRTNGEPCKAWAMPNGKCRVHGGTTPKGLASPHLKTGRYSKYLPARLADRYQESKADARLLELREEVSLVDSRLTDLLQRVDTHEAGHWWKELQRIYAEFREAEGKSDIHTMRQRLADWGSVIQSGMSDYAAWNEVYGVLEQRRKLVESERKRHVEMQQMITSERAMLLISALVGIVQDHVTDKSTLAAISADVGKLIAIDVSN